MAYIRKTRDEYEIQQYTCQGWETVCSEDTYKEARLRFNEYRENQPEYLTQIVKRRVKLEQ